LGLRCRQKRKFKATTDSSHRLPVASNLLDRQFAVTAPNKAWVTDITYIATDEGWLYLAGIKDLFNGELVGYALDARMTQQLVMQALFRAVATKRPSKGLIRHSDRGSQYCSHADQQLLRQFGMQPSMSRKGNCWDNAPMESCWGSLKPNWCITAASPPASRLRARSRNTSRSSTTEFESRHDSAICRPPLSVSNTMQNI
jgi:putative transposase